MIEKPTRCRVQFEDRYLPKRPTHPGMVQKVSDLVVGGVYMLQVCTTPKRRGARNMSEVNPEQPHEHTKAKVKVVEIKKWGVVMVTADEEADDVSMPPFWLGLVCNPEGEWIHFSHLVKAE